MRYRTGDLVLSNCRYNVAYLRWCGGWFTVMIHATMQQAGARRATPASSIAAQLYVLPVPSRIRKPVSAYTVA